MKAILLEVLLVSADLEGGYGVSALCRTCWMRML